MNARPDGARRPNDAGWNAQRHLDQSVETALRSTDSTTGLWHPWADTTEPRIITDPKDDLTRVGDRTG